VAVHEERTQALKDLEEKLIRAEQWLSGSRLKVNASKTELDIFYKHDSARGSIYLSQIQTDSKAHMKVLGIVFDSQLEWSTRVAKSIAAAWQASKAMGLVRKYFTLKEMNFIMQHKSGSFKTLKKTYGQTVFEVMKKFKTNWQTFNL